LSEPVLFFEPALELLLASAFITGFAPDAREVDRFLVYIYISFL